MADKYITDLASATALAPTDVMLVSQGSATPKRAALSLIKSALFATGSFTRQLLDAGSIANVRTLLGLDAVPGAASMSKGHIFGLTLSVNTAAPLWAINVEAGQCRDSSDTYDLRLNSGMIKDLSTIWTPGSGSGGRDTGGSVVANTSYHVFLIRKSSDGSLDILFSTSALGPLMPSGYAALRRLGAVMTDATGYIRKFTQHGNFFQLADRTADYAGVANGAGPYLRQIAVPRGIPMLARVYLQSQGGPGVVTTFSGVYDPALGVPQLVTNKRAQIRRNIFKDQASADASYGIFDGDVWTDSNAQVYTHSDNTGDIIALGTYGWTDDRGQFL